MKTRCCNTRKFYENEKQNICANHKCTNFLGTTEVRKISYAKSLTVICLVMGFILFAPKNYSSSYALERHEPVRTPEKVVLPLTMENVAAEIKANNILCPDEVFAQIKIESAYLSSYLTKKTNNMLGMRYPYVRKTAAVGIFIPELDTIVMGNQQELKKYRKYLSYAVFANWQDAIKDYKYWQESNFNLNKVYLDFLRRNYAEDTAYVKKIKYVIKRDLAMN